jgi:hypothetical protein
MIDTHQEEHDFSALTTTDRSRLKRPCRSGTVVHIIVLLTPRGRSAVLYDLTLQDAVEPLGEGSAHLIPTCTINKRVVRLVLNDVVQCIHHSDHGTVIERYVSPVTAPVRITLGPSAIGILRCQDEI